MTLYHNVKSKRRDVPCTCVCDYLYYTLVWLLFGIAIPTLPLQLFYTGTCTSPKVLGGGGGGLKPRKPPPFPPPYLKHVPTIMMMMQ